MRLAHKGVLAVSIILVVELWLVATLAWLLDQAEHELWLEAHSMEVLSETDTLIRTFVDAGGILVYSVYAQNNKALENARKVAENIPVRLRSLHALGLDSPDETKLIDDIQRLGYRAFELLNRSLALISESRGSTLLLKGAGVESELQSVLARMRSVRLQLEELQVQRQQKQVVKRAMLRSNFRNFIVVVVLAHVVGSTVLALLFTRGLVAKIDILVENTNRLLKKKPLHPPMSGTDEIAHLDHVFHSMADAIQESELIRQEFISVLSHELRTPLTAINATLTLASVGTYGELNDKGVKQFQSAETNSAKLISLVNELLEVHKMQAGKFKMNYASTLISSIVQRAVSTVQVLAQKKQISLHTSSFKETEVFADPLRIEQVLINLLSNAIKYSTAGSQVVIAAARIEDEFVEISVKDEGPGISEEQRSKIFEKYHRTEEIEERFSTGLGLTICKSIVESHGGSIGVESEPGAGSRFWFRLPL